MGKRKKKSGNEIDSKRQKSGKAANSERPGKEKEIFTSIEFIQLLQDPVLYVKGLQRFCQASRLFRDSIITHDVVKAYISVSPECSEIFKCIEKGKTSSMNVCLVFETFFTILLRTGGNLAETYASVGVSMCRRILQAHLRELYGALSLRNPAKVIVPTLRMLTSMVMQGSECANDVVTSLDLGGKVMTALAKYQPAPKHEKQGASTNVRLCFVRFVLSFFMSDDVETLKQVLEARGFVDAVFRGLPKDPASVIHIFLSGLLDKVIKNLKIPKTNKIKLLAAHDVLLSVAELFSWDGNYDIDLDDEDEEKDQEKSADTCKTAGIEKIHQLAYDFLYHSCCPFKYGINFRDKQYGTSVRSQNHVLLKFLIDLKGASSNKFAHKLVVEILKACPDLLTSYLLTCNLSFDPRPSEKWFQNCDLVMDIYVLQPSVPPAVTDAAKTCQLPKCDHSKLVSMAISGIVPSAFKRSNMKAALKHANTEVQLQGCKILIMALNQLKTTIKFIENERNWTKSNFSQQERQLLKNVLCNETSKVLPDIGSVIGIWSSIESSKDTNCKAVQEQLLLVLSLYQQNLPEVFRQCQYDFSRLLHGIGFSIVTPSDNVVLYAIEIISHAPHKYKWFRKGESKQTSFYQLTKIISDLYKSHTLDSSYTVLTKVLDLFKKVCIINDIVAHSEDFDCLLVWIKNVFTANDPTETEFLLTFLDDLCAAVAKRPHRYKIRYLDKNTAFHAEASPSSTGVPSTDNGETEEWWENIPDIEIQQIKMDIHECSVADENQPGQKVGKKGTKHSISLLIPAVFEWINLQDNSEKVSKKSNSLDRYLVSVVTELYYLHTMTDTSGTFVNVLKRLSKQMEEINKLPMLETFLQLTIPGSQIKAKTNEENHIANLASWFGEIHRVFDSLASAKPGKNKNKLKKLQDTLDSAPSITDITNADSFTLNPFEIHSTKTLIAQSLNYISLVLQSSTIVLNEANVSCLKVVHFLMELIHTLLTKCQGDHFIAIATSILSNCVMKEAYFSAKNPQISAEISAKVNAIILRICLHNDNKDFVDDVGYYLEHFSNVLCESMSGRQSKDLNEVLVESFDKISSLLPIACLQKTLMSSATSLNKEKNQDQFNIHVAERCVHLLVQRSSFNPLASNEISTLFSLLLNVDVESDLGQLYLTSLVDFCTKFPTSVLHMNPTVLEWCIDKCENSLSFRLLEIALKHSFSHQSHFIKYVLMLLKSKHLDSCSPVIAKATEMPLLLCGSKFFEEKLLNKFKKYFKQLISEQLVEKTLDKVKTKFEGSLLTWAIEEHCISESLQDKLINKLADSFTVENVHSRWKVAETLLKKLPIEATDFRAKLTTSLLTIAHDALKSGWSSKMSFVLQVLTTLFEKLNSVVSLDDDLIQAWNQFVKSALKYQIASSEVCDFLRQRICKFNIENTHKLLQPTTIFKMLTSHSSFLEVALSGNSEFSQAKTSLMQLLHSLVQRCDTSALQTADYHYLLAAYHATLSDADQCILQILLLYEANGVSTADCSPFLWGNTAVESYQARKNMGETLYRNPAPNKVLSCIDSEIMNNTLREFPIRRRLITLQQLREEPTKNQHYIEEVSDLRLTPRYDPQFLLSVFSTMLVPENLVDCRSFLRQGALSFLLLSLSSHCPMIRNLAAGCLARYYDLAEPLWFSEKNLTLYLLRCVRNAAQIEKGSFKKISTIMALYLSKMAEIMMQPAEHIYFALNRFLLVKPGLDLRHVPEFYVLFFSTDMEYKTERSWMLDLMAQGTRDMGDYHVTQSRQLLRILMTYYASPTSDNKTRAQVLQVLERCCAIRGAAFDLIFNHGLLPWLLNVVTQQNDSTATRDGGSDVSKRQDPTSGVVAIFKSLWCALDPERTHNVALVDEKQTPDTGISRSGNIPSVVSHSEEVEDIVADEQEEVSTIGVTRDFPKRFTPVSLRLARQLTNLSLELLSNLLRVSGADSAEFKRFDLSSDAVKPFIDVLHVLTLMFAYLRDKYGDDVIGSDVRISDRQAKVLFHVGELLEHNHADGIINCALVLLCWKHVGRSCLSTNPLQIITWTMRTIVTSQYIGKILGESVLWFKNWIKVLGETKDEPLADDHKVAVQRLLLQVSEFLCFNSSDITNFEDLYMLLLEATKCVGNLPVPAMPENETFRHLALSVTLDNQRKHLMSECLKSSHL